MTFARPLAAAALTLALLAAPVAMAQAPAPAAPAAGTAAAPALAPEHVALARQVVEASGASSSFDNVIPAFIEQAKAMFLPTNPDLGRQFNEVGDALRREFQPRVNELIQAIAVSYAQRFTPDELRRILAFYQSADGQKLVRTIPVILEETFARSQQWSQVVTRDLVNRFREEFQKRGIRL